MPGNGAEGTPLLRCHARHSDCGSRYCSHLYVEKLQASRLPVSRHEELHCYGNTRAELLNGILKQGYGLGCSFKNKKQALAAAGEAVFQRDTRRPRPALNYETPENTFRRVA
ncbi:MAG: hypothetical protein LBP37_03305 [Spirochaetaceae bacterium]|nr:hypothetical protein [Spirochaetaceae bacterium]